MVDERYTCTPTHSIDVDGAPEKKVSESPPPHSSAFLVLARPSRLATGGNHPLYKILRTLVNMGLVKLHPAMLSV